MAKPESRALDIFDVMLLLWIVIAAVLLSEDALGETLGKGRYVFEEIVIFIFGAAYLSARRQNLPALFRLKGVSLKVIPGLILAAIGAAPLFDGLDRVIGVFIPFPTDYASQLAKSLAPANPTELWLVIIGVAVAAPLAEEAIFRGAIQQILEQRRGVTTGVMITALLFALIHLQYWWFIQLLVMGVLLGFLAWSFNSILPSVLFHAANNLLSLYVSINPSETFKEHYLTGVQLSPVVAAGALTVFILGLLWAYKSRDDVPLLFDDEFSN